MTEAHKEKMQTLGIPESVALTKEGIPRVYNALTQERADALCEAITTHPNFRTACAACFVSDRTVISWLRRGTMQDASPLMAEFAARFLASDAAHAKSVFETFKAQAAAGNGVAGQILKYMTARWRLTETEDLMANLDQGKKKTDNLEALLREPTPRLAHILRITGWVRHPAWGTESWGNIIDTTGETTPET